MNPGVNHAHQGPNDSFAPTQPCAVLLLRHCSPNPVRKSCLTPPPNYTHHATRPDACRIASPTPNRNPSQLELTMKRQRNADWAILQKNLRNSWRSGVPAATTEVTSHFGKQTRAKSGAGGALLPQGGAVAMGRRCWWVSLLLWRRDAPAGSRSWSKPRRSDVTSCTVSPSAS